MPFPGMPDHSQEPKEREINFDLKAILSRDRCYRCHAVIFINEQNGDRKIGDNLLCPACCKV